MIKNIDNNICIKDNLEIIINTIKQTSPKIKSPIALVDIEEVVTLSKILFGVSKYLSKLPLLI